MQVVGLPDVELRQVLVERQAELREDLHLRVTDGRGGLVEQRVVELALLLAQLELLDAEARAGVVLLGLIPADALAAAERQEDVPVVGPGDELVVGRGRQRRQLDGDAQGILDRLLQRRGRDGEVRVLREERQANGLVAPADSARAALALPRGRSRSG